MNKKNFKIIGKRKVIKLSAAFFIISLLFGSCKKEDTNIGDSLQSESLNLSTTDTFTLTTYSEEVDSLDSDETSVGLLGYYKDPVFGDVECGLVTQLRLSSPVSSFGDTPNLVVDSVVLGLRYTDINYYANLSDMTVEVYELSNELYREDQSYYTFQLPANEGLNLVETGSEVVSPEVIGQQYLDNGDTLDAHLRIRLDPALGQKWLDDHGSGIWSNEDQFVSYFNGIYVKADGSSLSTSEGTVLYFSMEHALSNVTVYYHDSNDLIPLEFEFSINSSSARYNYMNFDRSGTEVEALLTDNSKGAEAFYMQGSSIRAVIEFPHIMDFNYDSDGNYDPKIINRAALILPIQDFTPDPFDPATHLFIARIVDDKLSTATVDYGSATASGTASYDESKKEFRFTMTRELMAILNGSIENNGFRIYAPSFFGSSIERIVFNGSNTSLKEKPRLEITYTEY